MITDFELFQSPRHNNKWVAFKDGVSAMDAEQETAVKKLEIKLARLSAPTEQVNPALAFVRKRVAQRTRQMAKLTRRKKTHRRRPITSVANLSVRSVGHTLQAAYAKIIDHREADLKGFFTLTSLTLTPEEEVAYESHHAENPELYIEIVQLSRRLRQFLGTLTDETSYPVRDLFAIWRYEKLKAIAAQTDDERDSGKMTLVYRFVAGQPHGATEREIIAGTGVQRETVCSSLSKLRSSGKIMKNGELRDNQIVNVIVGEDELEERDGLRRNICRLLVEAHTAKEIWELLGRPDSPKIILNQITSMVKDESSGVKEVGKVTGDHRREGKLDQVAVYQFISQIKA